MITINVTQEDIDHGEKGMCRKCPISLAIQRVTNFDYCYVNDIFVSFYNGDPLEELLIKKQLPEVARKFIRIFDGNIGDVFPFSFELDM
jgi:hypothetical protein